ncbi:MAG TPA: hypothetical protein PLH70_08190, partial [Bacteroidales bacterium]|nr:hypothetical protein [Bacteroidales bacterium]HPZ04146.1 hypothetical protein [Bacteroidales bacterium]HQB75763.1 hypothetical protein [Bacteroidales bacterium]
TSYFAEYQTNITFSADPNFLTSYFFFLILKLKKSGGRICGVFSVNLSPHSGILYLLENM